MIAIIRHYFDNNEVIRKSRHDDIMEDAKKRQRGCGHVEDYDALHLCFLIAHLLKKYHHSKALMKGNLATVLDFAHIRFFFEFAIFALEP